MALRRTAFRVLVLFALVVLAAVPSFAQTVTGTMNGTVTDRSDARLPGVTVTIRNTETGLERVVTTNGEGFFNAPFLPIGVYNVTADLSGFGKLSRSNVPINLNQTTVQDFMIDPQITESITVNADAPRINVTDGEIKQTMRGEEIMNRPNANQTNFLTLAESFAGFQENPSGGQNNPTLSSGSSINFNGAGTRGTSFQIDGVNNDDSSENQNRQGVALATIKSFQVLSNSFSAEFGRGYGAVVLVQTKSGTNDITGEVYGYAQDAEYNAKSFFQRPSTFARADNYRRQYGFVLGMPIIHDRLFAFVNTDQVDNAGTGSYTRSVLTPTDLALPRLTLNNDTPANRAFIESVVARFPKVTPNDSRNVRAYTTNRFFDRPDEDYSARFDANLSASNTLIVRGQRSHQIRDNEDIIIGEATQQNNRQSNYGATWTNILTSNTFQEVRYGLGLRSTNVGIKQGNDTPIIRFTGITFPHTIGDATTFPVNRNQRDQQLVYNISSARFASHTIKLGTDLRRSKLDDRADNAHRGFYNFTNVCGGVTYPSAIDAFFAGCVRTYTKAYGPNYLEHNLDEENVYGQDDWRPRQNLILNLGVRWENVNPPEERENRIDYIYSASNYIDPRLGFAYTPEWDRNRLLRAITGGNGRFSIRGGFGVYHGRVFQSIFSQSGLSIRSNPPNAASLPFENSTNLADPTNGFVFTPGTPTARIQIVRPEEDLKMPETRQWNLTLERQLFTQSRLRMSYIGTVGKNLLRYRFENLPQSPLYGAITVVDHPFNNPAGTLPNLRGRQITAIAKDWRCAGTGFYGLATTAACPTAVPIADNEISLRVPRTNERRADPRYTTIFVIENGSASSYHAGQLEWETGAFHGFQGRMTYTFSKAIDEGSEATATGAGDTNFFPATNGAYARGLSRFDTRHRMTMNGSYSLPFWRDRKGLLGSLLGGWQVSASMKLSSGTPFTIVDGAGVDIDFDGFTDARPICINPQYCGGWHVNNPNTSRSELPRSAFRRATQDDKVSDLIGRNTYYTDGLEQVDLGFYKRFALPFGKDGVVLRLEVYNLFDHVTWGFPVNDINSADFGRILGVNYTPRTLQAGVRYMF